MGFPIDGLDRFASMSSSPLQFVNAHTQRYLPIAEPSYAAASASKVACYGFPLPVLHGRASLAKV
jgi:hypothetical protein